jgi:hypothetical protein
LIPAFAVVGHPNKGKSSIVATLAENERIPISATPGTTQHADRFTFTIDDEPLYQLIDTPGFQRSRAVLEWLRSRDASATQRPRAIEAFLAAHEADPRFRDECTLLRPIVEGAGILYVVDGTKPYGSEFDVEMEILRWTGRPRMALINLIGEGNYVDEWRQALGQYFSIVREFDAMQADFATRLGVLRAFGELDEAWRVPMERAVEALEAERRHRRAQCAREIADSIAESLLATERVSIGDRDPAELEGDVAQRLRNGLRQREQRSRDVVQAIYRHEQLPRDEDKPAVTDVDLFTREGWELFGLSKTQLVLTGSVSGAVAGLGIDALVGGSSFLLGSGIGAVVGAVGTWFGSDELAKTKVLGDPLGGRVLEVGPVSQPNFPWVLLGRAWVHHHLVQERNHALRSAISMRLAEDRNVMDQLPDELRTRLTRSFKRLRSGDPGRDALDELVERVQAVLERDPLESLPLLESLS